MANGSRGKDLGMGRSISRRDFLDGAAMAVAASSLPVSSSSALAQNAAEVMPPRRLGERGHHPGSNVVAHKLRDGIFWRDVAGVRASGETYDLVVVGGGISGLAAAMAYREQAGAACRILIIENHDDFGGHAKRNEFVSQSGRVLIGYGGSQSLQSPSYFSPAVNAMLRTLDLDLTKFASSYYDRDWTRRHGLRPACFFPREAFGRDRLVTISERAADWVRRAPLSRRAQQDLIRLTDNPPDYFAGLSQAEKRQRLASMSYQQFLLEVARVDPQLVTFFAESTAGYFGVGIDAASALDAGANGNPGFSAMNLGALADPAMSPTGRLVYTDPDPYIYHFPDGNHGLARALLRHLNFAALPAGSMEALVTTPVDYARLDAPSAATRIRLESTVVRVQHLGAVDRAEEVEVTYAGRGSVESVRAKHVVLACWHRVIPYLCEGLQAPQVEALNDQVKVPLIYTNVLLRNWSAFKKLGVESIRAPGHFWHNAQLDFPVSMGSYRFADQVTDPILLHLSTIPLFPGQSPRDQAAAGRRMISRLDFDYLEYSIRDLLGRALGRGGFDPAQDIEAICVNRWSHGYAYEYMRPWDKYWPTGPLPIETARRRFGRVAIANSDSGAYAYAHSAVDQGIRAVRDLLGARADAPPTAAFPGPPVSLFTG
jgi:spermidine dehydrogenase